MGSTVQKWAASFLNGLVLTAAAYAKQHWGVDANPLLILAVTTGATKAVTWAYGTYGPKRTTPRTATSGF
jgi:hypothetical protein